MSQYKLTVLNDVTDESFEAEYPKWELAKAAMEAIARSLPLSDRNDYFIEHDENNFIVLFEDGNVIHLKITQEA